MAFTSFLGFGKETNASFQSFPTFGKSKLESSEDFLRLAMQQGGAIGQVAEELVHPERSILATVGQGFKKAFGTFVDVISLPGEITAGIISPTKTIKQAIHEDLRVSDIFFGEPDKNASAMVKVGSFFTRFAVDVLTDPLTYISFGAGGIFTGAKAVSKLSLTDDLAKFIGLSSDDLVKVGAYAKGSPKEFSELLKLSKDDLLSPLAKILGKSEQQVARNITKNAGDVSYLSKKAMNLVNQKIKYQRTGLTKAAELVGKKLGLEGDELARYINTTINAPIHRENAMSAMSSLLAKHPALIETYLDKGGIKFFNQTLLSGQRINSAMKAIPGFTVMDNATASIRHTVGSLFDSSLTPNGRVTPEAMQTLNKWQDLATSQEKDTINHLVKVWKDFKVTASEDDLIRSCIENNKIPTDPRLFEIWKATKGYQKKNLKEMWRAGVKVTEVPNYMPHFLVDEGVKKTKYITTGSRNIKHAREAEIAKFVNLETGEYVVGTKEIAGLTQKFRETEVTRITENLDKTLKKLDIESSNLIGNIEGLRNRILEVFKSKSGVEFQKLLKDLPSKDADNLKQILSVFKDSIDDLDIETLAANRAKEVMQAGVKVEQVVADMSEDALIALKNRLAKGETGLVDDIEHVNFLLKMAEPKFKVTKHKGGVAGEIRDVAEKIREAAKQRKISVVEEGGKVVKQVAKTGKAKDFADDITKGKVDNIIKNIDELPLNERIKLDIDLHNDWIAKNKKYPDAKEEILYLQKNTQAKRKALDIFEGRNTDPKDIDEAIKTFKADRKTHMVKPTNEIEKKWDKKWVQIYDEWLDELGAIKKGKVAGEEVTEAVTTVSKGLNKTQVARFVSTLRKQFEDNPTGVKHILDTLIGKEQKITDILADIDLAKMSAKVEAEGLPEAARFFIDKDGSNFERVRATVEDAKSIGVNFDPSAISTTVQASSNVIKGTTLRHMVDEIATKFGVAEEKATTGFRQISIKGLKEESVDFSKFMKGNKGENLYFHPHLADKIEDFLGVMMRDEATSSIMKSFDKVQGVWKASVTSIFPAFHGRNAISNVFLNFLDIGLESLNPTNHLMAADLLKKEHTAAKLASQMIKPGTAGEVAKEKFWRLMDTEILTDQTGSRYTFGELRRLISEKNVAFNPNIVGALDVSKPIKEVMQDLFPATTKSGMAKKVSKKVLPVSQEFLPFQVGRKIGNKIEEQSRLVNFLSHLRKTGDAQLAAQRTKQFLFDYQNLTNFEKAFMRRIIPFYCVPETYEILTKDGWKKHYELTIGEDVAVYKHKDNICSWKPLDNIAVFDYDGQLFEMGNKKAGYFKFTPDHGFPVIDHNGERVMKKGYQLRSNHKIPIIPDKMIFDSNDKKIDSEFAKVLGWILTDGHIDLKRKRVIIYQSVNKFANEIRELLNGRCCEYLDKRSLKNPNHSDMVCFTLNGELKKKILEYLPNKEVCSSLIKYLSKDSAKAIWDAMYKGDGNTIIRNGKPSQQFFAQQNQAVLDFFQIVSTLLGKIANKNPRDAYVRQSWKYLYPKDNFDVVDYNGKIWCPELNNECWIMRNEEGKILLSQNTFTRKNLALQAQVLATTPGKIAAEVKFLTGLGDVISGEKLTKEQEDVLPDWIKSGIKILSDKKGSTVEMLGSLGTPIEQPFQAFQPNQLLGSVSPLIRVPIEQMSGYSFFQGKPLSDVTNAAAFKKAPKAIKQLIGYTEVTGTRSDGSPFTWYVSLRPERMNLLLNLPPTSRVFSALKQMQAVDVSTQSKILQQTIGIRPYSFDLEQEAAKRERELRNKIEELLTDAGITAQFKKTFIPKD